MIRLIEICDSAPRLLAWIIGLCAFLLPACDSIQANPQNGVPPNIILIVAEDLGPRVGAFGDTIARTPHIDALARRGVMYPNTFSTAGVCAPSRAALITGVHQQALGAMHMRTRSAKPTPYLAVPPPNVKAFPELLRRAGYYTVNRSKTDYQFGEPFTIWDESGPQSSWNEREEDQPFFAMITLNQSHESYLWSTSPSIDVSFDHPSAKKISARNAAFDTQKTVHTDPSLVSVPPYYPDTEKVRQSIARHYDNLAVMDMQVGKIMEQLDAEGLLENSIVIWTTDHGDGIPRAKRTVYDSGILVPLIVKLPGNLRSGETDGRLVSFVDLSKTILEIAGAETPDYMKGKNFISGDRRSYIYAAADRMDEVPGRMRVVRDDRFKLIQNYRPDLPRLGNLAFRDMAPIMQELWAGHINGTLPDAANSLFSSPSPEIELYDTVKDPHEITNLAKDPLLAQTRSRLLEELSRWIAEIGDQAIIDEMQLSAQFWPKGKQPVTVNGYACVKSDRIQLRSNMIGASIGYRFIGDVRWSLYSKPIIPSNAKQGLQVKSIRYGYGESEISTYDIESIYEQECTL